MSKIPFDKTVKDVQQMMGGVDKHADTIEALVDKLVDDACGPLDDYMAVIRPLLMNPDRPPTDSDLDDICLNLPAMMYFVVERKERLGIKKDLARAMKRDMYNNAYEELDGQVGPRKVAGEQASRIEQLTEDVYARAHQKMDSKIWAATELLNSVKKVMSRRMNERFS